jgi:16S rRNA G966 N2-methylase RsmD
MREYRNQLFAADNLPVLRDKIGAETVDLVYLDPPFNSKQAYNVIFTERHGRKSTINWTRQD